MPTDTSEKGLEALIVAAMTGPQAASPASVAAARQTAEPYGIPGWIPGDPHDYDPTPRRHWTWITTAPSAVSSWRGCRARSTGAA
jgi:hypothetical protein